MAGVYEKKESVWDLLILTFISIRGRQQGEPKAANKLGEILVALPVSPFSNSAERETCKGQEAGMKKR